MPKRRVPGHLRRTGRRRRDKEPNVPPAPAERAEVRSVEPASLAPANDDPPSARPLRPTLRAQTAASRFVRTPPPTIDITTEYRYVIGDLRQIGVLALVAFLVLGVLAVVIR